MNHRSIAIVTLLLSSLITACSSPNPGTAVVTPDPPTPTSSPSPTPSPTPLPTSTPTPTPPKEFTICQAEEPNTLFIYGGPSRVAYNVLEAIYDGPIDNRSFGYQGVIFEKLPSLADGDAVINTVTVNEGDSIVAADTSPSTLEAGMVIRPAGCNAADCEITYEGGAVEMDQMVVTGANY